MNQWVTEALGIALEVRPNQACPSIAGEIARSYMTQRQTISLFRVIVTLLGGIALNTPLHAQWTALSGGGIYYTGGNVGIGTPTPNWMLHVYNNSGISPKITVEGGSSALFPLFQLIDGEAGGSNWNIEKWPGGSGHAGLPQ